MSKEWTTVEISQAQRSVADLLDTDSRDRVLM
jgi:hypothetical protein